MDEKNKKKIQKLIGKLDSPENNEIFTALVEIRKNVLKGKSGTSYFFSQGGVQKLVKVLQKKHDIEKIVDVALSAIGNICMEKNGRLLVSKTLCIGYVGDILNEWNVESIQNRCVRTLANIALDQDSIDEIIVTGGFSTLGKLMKTTETKENILTYSRAARLFGRSAQFTEKLLKEEVVLHLAKQLSHSEEEVRHVVLRTLYEISAVSCTPDFASQLNSSTAVSQILSMLKEENNTTSHQALQLLHRLSLQKNFRPGFGSSDGIKIVFELVKDDTISLDKNLLLNILCMCCKEAVNRVKVRNSDILPFFLQSLEQEQYSQLHDKLISALQCFVFDEAGISILLEHGLVPVLMTHLQRAAQFESTVPSIETLIPTFIKEEDMKKVIEFESHIFNSLYQLPPQKSSSMRKISESIENLNLQNDLEASHDDIDSEDIPPKHSSVVYSIDSPTYVAHTDWNMDEDAGEKCKQSFYNYLSDPDHGSPLSTVSFNSPERCSSGSPQSSKNYSFVVPGCSSWSDDEGSMEVSKSGLPGSTVNKDPRYGMVCSVPYTCDSPVKCESPTELSPRTSPSSREFSPLSSPVSHNEENEFSSCENSDNEETVPVVKTLKNESDKQAVDKKEEKRSTIKSECKDLTNVLSTKRKLEETGSNEDTRDVNKRSDVLQEDMENDNPAKKRRLKSPIPGRSQKRCIEIENQILILLSRISQTTDPSPFLVNKEMVCCMLDYLNQVENPEPRAARFLSRLASNPLCFDKLIKMNFVTLVYFKLNLHKIERELVQLSNSCRCILQVTDIEKNIESRKSGAEFSFTKSHKGPYSFLDIPEDTRDQDLTSPEVKSGQTLKFPKVKTKDRMEQKVSIQAKVGMTLLQDMCIQADSHFGRGEIDRLLYKYPDEIKEWLPIEMCYISWLTGMQGHYLGRMSFMDQVITLLNQKDNIDVNPKYQAAIHGFMFLCKIAKFSIENQRYIPKISQESCEDKDETKEIQESCNFKGAAVDNEVEFVFDDGHKIACCRNRLSECSPLFEAMLKGQFSEANQNIVTINDTRYRAFLFLVHFLYKCSEQCSVINCFQNCEPTVDRVNDCLEIISLANKYMVIDLQDYLLPILSSRLLTAESACHVFHFALLYDFPNLADDSVISVTKRGSMQDRMEGFYKFIAGQNRGEFVCTLKELFKC